MVNVLVSRSSGLCLSPGQGLCVVLLGKTFNSHCPSLPRCVNGNQQILYSWIKKLQPDGPLDSYAEFFYLRDDPQGFHLQT